MKYILFLFFLSSVNSFYFKRNIYTLKIISYSKYKRHISCTNSYDKSIDPYDHYNNIDFNKYYDSREFFYYNKNKTNTTISTKKGFNP